MRLENEILCQGESILRARGRLRMAWSFLKADTTHLFCSTALVMFEALYLLSSLGLLKRHPSLVWFLVSVKTIPRIGSEASPLGW